MTKTFLIFILAISVCVFAPLASADPGAMVLVNGAGDAEHNYPEFEHDLDAFRQKFPHTPTAFLNAGGPLDNLTIFRNSKGENVMDDFGFSELQRGSVNTNAKAATRDNFLQAVRTAVESKKGDVLIFLGAHGAPDQYVLWNAPGIKYSEIRAALSRDPHQDERFLRVINYECFGGAAVVDPARSISKSEDARGYLDRIYPRNHCGLSFANEAEFAYSDLDHTVLPRSFPGRELIRTTATNLKLPLGSLDDYRQSRSSWPRYLASTNPLTLEHLKTKIAEGNRKNNSGYATYVLTSDYLVDDLYRVACGLKRNTPNIDSQYTVAPADRNVCSNDSIAKLRSESNAWACESINLEDRLVQDGKIGRHNLMAEYVQIHGIAEDCKKISLQKTNPNKFATYAKFRDSLYHPLKSPLSPEALTAWSYRSLSAVAMNAIGTSLSKEALDPVEHATLEKNMNKCVIEQSHNRFQSLKDITGRQNAILKSFASDMETVGKSDYLVQAQKRKFVERLLSPQSPNQAAIKPWAERYQNLRACETGKL